MDSKVIGSWIWALAPGDYTGTEAQVLLAVLACNVAGVAPSFGEVRRHIAAPQSSWLAARKSLVERVPPVLVMFEDRLALCRFRHLLPTAHTFPGERTNPGMFSSKNPDLEQEKRSENLENSPETQEKRSENSGRNDDFSLASRAVVASDLKDNNNGGGALNAPLEALQLFAENVCLMQNAAAAVELAFNRYGSAVLVSALEQFHYCYTARNRTASNPPGQLLAWCKNPSRMDKLPPRALKVSAWLERRAARERPVELLPRPVELHKVELSPEETALIHAQQAYALGKASRPSREVELAAARAREARQKKEGLTSGPPPT